MFLSKKESRPVGLGIFCTIGSELKGRMEETPEYKSAARARYDKSKLHVADADILYVMEDNVFDVKGMMRVLPISFNDDGYWAEKATYFAENKKSFIVSKSQLNIISGTLNDRESCAGMQQGRLNYVIDIYNRKFNLKILHHDG